MTIIGLSGYARAGKDTVADHLVTAHGFTKIGFADALKEAVYTLNPMIAFPHRVQDLVDGQGWEDAKNSYEVRRLLQVMGTEVVRNLFGANTWADIVEREILHSPQTNWVIPDCRFPNEAEMIGRHGGALWRVHRPDVGPTNSHSSENSLDGFIFDAHLTNDTTVAALYESVDYCLRKITHA